MELQRHQAGPWTACVRSEQGLVRARQEDAWRIESDARFADRRADAFAIFDGLGGEPRGQEAALAAATGLRDALASSLSPAEVLPRLNERVMKTRGATTAVVALMPRNASHGWLLSAGDSAAYALDADGNVTRMTPRDQNDRKQLTDYLGHPALRGHAQELRLQPAATLALVTDGIDGVVDPSWIEPLLSGDPKTWEKESTTLFDRVFAAGAPDNATLMLLRKA